VQAHETAAGEQAQRPPQAMNRQEQPGPPDVLADGPRASQYTPPQPTSRRGRLGTATLQPPPASSHTDFSEFQ